LAASARASLTEALAAPAVRVGGGLRQQLGETRRCRGDEAEGFGLDENAGRHDFRFREAAERDEFL
jgi:hypothetical protein